MLRNEIPNWPNHEFSDLVHAAGMRWYVQKMGQGPPLLLLHGTAASVHSWRALMPFLARAYSCLAVDLPGHGFTDAIPLERISLGGMSDLVSELLAALQFRPEVVVGHSAGAVIACDLALRHRIEARAIVGINGAFLPLSALANSVMGPLASLIANSPGLSRLIARRAQSSANVARMLEATGSKLAPEEVEYYARLLRNPVHVASAVGMMSHWDLSSFTNQLSELTTPLALLVGTADRAVPMEQAFEVMQHVRGATFYPLQGLGHLAHEEAPELVGAKILEILRSDSLS